MLITILSLINIISTFVTPELEQIEANDDILLIYTDIELENLTACYKTNNSLAEKKLNLENAVDFYDPTGFLYRNNVYRLVLPDETEGVINFEIKSDNNTPDKIASKFTRRIKENKPFYLLTHPKREVSDDNQFVYEANYTYIRSDTKYIAILVISESLDKKIQLDKSVEYYQLKEAMKINKTCEVFLKDMYNNLRFIRNSKSFLEEFKYALNNFIFGLLYEILEIYIINVSFECVYNSPLYESYIIRELGEVRLFELFSLKFEDLFQSGLLYYEVGLDEFAKTI